MLDKEGGWEKNQRWQIQSADTEVNEWTGVKQNDRKIELAMVWDIILVGLSLEWSGDCPTKGLSFKILKVSVSLFISLVGEVSCYNSESCSAHL